MMEYSTKGFDHCHPPLPIIIYLKLYWYNLFWQIYSQTSSFCGLNSCMDCYHLGWFDQTLMWSNGFSCLIAMVDCWMAPLFVWIEIGFSCFLTDYHCLWLIEKRYYWNSVAQLPSLHLFKLVLVPILTGVFLLVQGSPRGFLTLMDPLEDLLE